MKHSSHPNRALSHNCMDKPSKPVHMSVTGWSKYKASMQLKHSSRLHILFGWNSMQTYPAQLLVTLQSYMSMESTCIRLQVHTADLPWNGHTPITDPNTQVVQAKVVSFTVFQASYAAHTPWFMFSRQNIFPPLSCMAILPETPLTLMLKIPHPPTHW